MKQQSKHPKIVIEGKAHWAKFSKAQKESNEGKFSLDVCDLTPDSIKLLEEHGVKVGSGEGEKEYKGRYVSSSSIYKPEVWSGTAGTPFDTEGTLVGNGSSVRVSATLKPWDVNGKTGVKPYLNGVIITDLVEYEGGSRAFEGEDYSS